MNYEEGNDAQSHNGEEFDTQRLEGDASWRLKRMKDKVKDFVEGVKESAPRETLHSLGAAAGQARDYVNDAADQARDYVENSTMQDMLEDAARYARIPLINASCPVEHPCQAFADVMTMIEKKGPVKKAKVALLWGYRTANPPAGLTNSLMLMAGKLGFELSVACPDGFEPDMTVKAGADQEAALSGGSVKIVRSYEEAVKGADFVSIYSWVSPEVFAKGLETHFKGDPEFQEKKKKLKEAWCVTGKTMSLAPRDCMVMHCMPVSRNNEVTDEVLNSPQSIIFDEAENRLHTEKAILALLLGGYR